MGIRNLEVIHPPTKDNMGGVFVISSTVSAEQDTGITSALGMKPIFFMTSVDDTYLLFDDASTMTDIVIADYAGDERCVGPFAAGTQYTVEVAARSRYFTVITASNTGRFCWWNDR